MLTVAIGDVHGMIDRLDALLVELDRFADQRREKTRLVFLGDYIDRGPDSAAVVRRVRVLQAQGAVCLLGNHEEMAIQSSGSDYAMQIFLQNGGAATIRSFGSSSSFDEALQWMSSLPTWHEDSLRYFVHAGVDPDAPLADQTNTDRLWIRGPFLRHTALFQKYVCHGHTPTVTLKPWRDTPDIQPNRVNVDTGAAFGGKLSAAIFDNQHSAPIHTISV